MTKKELEVELTYCLNKLENIAIKLARLNSFEGSFEINKKEIISLIKEAAKISKEKRKIRKLLADKEKVK